jgi:MFS transporter, ACS family, glucarate transporter
MPYRFRVLGLLFALVFVMYLDRLCIAVAGPRMQREMAISPSHWGWVIGAFTFAYALFEIPSGILGDRIGPRKILTRIVLSWSGFTALTGVATSFRALLAVRFLFGAGEAGAFPNCTSAVSRWVPKAERARALSVFWTATAMSGAVTPSIVVAIQQRHGWRASFYIFGCLGVFWSAIWYWWFRDSPTEKAGVSSEEIEKIGPPQLRPKGGVKWDQLLRNSNFLRLLLMYHTYCWGAYFYLSWLHTYLERGRGLTENQMAIAAGLPSCAGLAGVLAGGYFSDRLARSHSLRFARCTIGSTGLILSGLLLLGATMTPNKWVAVGLLAIGLGAMDLMLPVAWAICVDTGGEYAGTISGAMNAAGQVGSLISSVAFGYWVEWYGSYDRALMPLAAMLVASGIIFAGIDPSRKMIPDPVAAEQILDSRL